MVTLNTLRNKGGILLAVVIGLALVAFVLGDLLTSGSTMMNSSKMVVGKIDGEKISTMEYERAINMLTDIQRITTGRESSTEEQNEMIRLQAWDLMIREKALNPQLAKVGLTITDQEMVELVSGKYVSPLILEMFSDPQTGMFYPEEVRQWILQAAYDETGQRQMFWNYLQTEVADQSLLLKFRDLSNKSAYVTSFEAQQMAELNSRTYDVRYVVERYTDIPDSTVQVTDAEMRSYYAAHKPMFQQQEGREIEYVTFEALPSAEDYLAAEEKVNGLAEGLARTDNVQQFITMNSQSGFDSRYYNEDQLIGELGNFALTAGPDQLYGPILSGDQWTVARIADSRMMPDSVRLSNIMLPITAQATADSLADALRKGGDFAEAAAFYSQDQQSSIQGGDLGMMDPQTLVPALAEMLKDAQVGDIQIVPLGQALHVIKVTERKGISRKIQLGVLSYNVEPSTATRNDAYTQANRFASTAGSDFDKAVSEGALAKRVATIGSNDRTVAGLPQSRELARWAFNGKRGETSGVMEFGNSFVIAKLADVRETGTATFDQAKSTIQEILLTEKKGQIIAGKMAGASSLESLAASLNTQVVDSSQVNFQSFMAPGTGFDPAFPGGVAALTSAGALTKPIIGRIGVYVAQANGVLTEEVSPEIEKARLAAEAEQTAFMNTYQAFLELLKIEDTRYRFY